MSHDAETELWLLAGELQQLEGATHYFSDLKSTRENYEDQCQYFAQQSSNLIEAFNRLCAHLGVIGIEQSPPLSTNDPDNNDEIPF